MAAKDKFKQMFGRKSSSDHPLAGHKRYTKIRTLGQGSYGVVLLAVDNQTKEKVAPPLDMVKSGNKHIVGLIVLMTHDLSWKALLSFH